MRRRALTLAIAAAGAAAFLASGLPLPILLGPMAACLVAALAGARLDDVRGVGEAVRAILGVAIGTSVTPDLVSRLPSMALTVAAIPVFVMVIGALSYPFFRRVCGFDHATAWYGAMPGGLTDMLVFGIAAGGDPRALSLIHATRVLAIVSVAPFLLTAFYGIGLDARPGAAVRAIPAAELGLMLAAGLVGWFVATRVGLFGAAIFGPMIAAAALSLAGLIENRPPAEAIWAAQFFIGVAVGARYVGVTPRELRLFVGAGLANCLLLALATLAFAEAIALAGLAPALDAFLAFAPGGQAEMAMIAIIAGADLAFVVTHHLVRLVLIIVFAPLAARIFRA